MRVRPAVWVLGAVTLLVLSGFYAKEQGLPIPQAALGLVGGLAILGGFVALYLRDLRDHPEDDDDDEHQRRLGRVVIKFGCLLFVVGTVATLLMALLVG